MNAYVLILLELIFLIFNMIDLQFHFFMIDMIIDVFNFLNSILSAKSIVHLSYPNELLHLIIIETLSILINMRIVML